MQPAGGGAGRQVRLIGAVAALVLSSACIPLKKGQRTLEYRQEMLDNWVGASVGELVEKWGPPDSTFDRPDGLQVYTYDRRTQFARVKTKSSAVAIYQWYAVGSSQSKVDPAGRMLCRSFFSVEKNVVVHSSFKGPSCETFGVPFLGVYGRTGVDGLHIEEVVPRSPGDSFGLRPGMVLVELDEARVRSERDVEAVLRKHHAGDEVRLRARASPNEWLKGVIELGSEPK